MKMLREISRCTPPLVRKGGIVAFHDIVMYPPETGCEISRFWN